MRAKTESKLRELLAALLSRAAYVCAHKFGQKDPVGTRVIAVDDLRAEIARVVAALRKL